LGAELYKGKIFIALKLFIQYIKAIRFWSGLAADSNLYRLLQWIATCKILLPKYLSPARFKNELACEIEEEGVIIMDHVKHI
jgi:hypothetical protein